MQKTLDTTTREKQSATIKNITILYIRFTVCDIINVSNKLNNNFYA